MRAKANPEKARERGRRWAAANPEKYQASVKRSKERNHEGILQKERERRAANREEYNARARARYAANREKELERQRLYREGNRDVTRAAARAWNKTPRGKASKTAVRHNRRAAVKNGGTATSEEIATLFAGAKRCPYCGRRFSEKLPKTLDHVTPLAKGGLHVISNLTVACRPCNAAKNDRIILLL